MSKADTAAARRELKAWISLKRAQLAQQIRELRAALTLQIQQKRAALRRKARAPRPLPGSGYNFRPTGRHKAFPMRGQFESEEEFAARMAAGNFRKPRKAAKKKRAAKKPAPAKKPAKKRAPKKKGRRRARRGR